MPITSIKSHLVTATLGLSLWAFAWYTQSHLAGLKPTASYDEVEEAADPELSNARGNIKSDPENIENLRIFATLLGTRLQREPSDALYSELKEVLAKMLLINPKDPQAVLTSANLAFNRHDFPEAIKLYLIYLEVDPSDLSTRSNLGAAYSFAGKFEEAFTQFNAVEKIDPKNFGAKAYYSIALAQMGKTEEAIKKGREALPLAPEAEAKNKLQAFLDSLSQPKGLAELLKSNPIAGPKFVRLEEGNTEIVAYFKDFPMGQMPEFAKQKFFAGIKAGGLKKVLIFKDQESGRELSRLEP